MADRTSHKADNDRRATGAGINVSPGSRDDGWTRPPSVPLPDGTRLQLHKDGEALHDALEHIRAAQSRICVETYIFASDATGQAYADALSRKARDGVQVRLIFDSYGSFGGGHLYRSTPQMFRAMHRSGILMEEFHPVRPWAGRYSWRPVNRDHRKLVVVDDDYATLGGLNIGQENAGPWVIRARVGDPWRDTAVSVHGPGSKMFLHAFARTWRYCHLGGHVKRAAYQFGLPPDGPLGVLASVPTHSSPLRTMLKNYLRAARTSIDLTMAYFAPDAGLICELTEAAQRGVRVRLMLPARSDIKVLVWAARSFYERLMDAGVEVYERMGTILHAKTMVIDGRISIVGSLNLDERSIEYNLELSAVIQSAVFGGQMADLFDHDVAYAHRIDPTAWRNRPWSDRITQWLVIRGRYLL